MMQIDILVEEPSAEEALRHILPKLNRKKVNMKIINMGSKYRLLKNLPDRLRGYRQRIDKGEKLRVAVLVDRDRDDCMKLKENLEKMAKDANLSTKTSPGQNRKFVVLNRILIEELESWFLGDAGALRQAFPSIQGIKNNARPFNNPDNGGSWEVLHKFLKKHGIYKNGYPKIAAAQKIAPHMNLKDNRSRSFQVFICGMKTLLA